MSKKADLVTIKTSTDALRRLKIIAALRGEKQYEVMERLTQQELNRINSPISNPSL